MTDYARSRVYHCLVWQSNADIAASEAFRDRDTVTVWDERQRSVFLLMVVKLALVHRSSGEAIASANVMRARRAAKSLVPNYLYHG
jgi:hypothetical protein